MYPGLVIVSNRLPVSVKKTDGELEFYPSIGGLATGLSSYTSNKKNRWIGWPGIANEDINDDERKKITKELKKHNCYPVFLSKKELDGFYNGFSNSVLWPLLHDLAPNQMAVENDSYWRAYKRVNQAFGEVVLSLSTSGTTVWVHDYQLMLLPSLLRAQRPHDKIGFFLHIPFPSHKMFANAPHSTELLNGLAGADLIGFHTTSYVQNFLDCCQHHDIGTVGPKELIFPDRVVRVTDFPMGIDYAKYVRATKQAAVRRELLKLRAKYRGKKVIISVDRMDVTKGIVERLDAYRAFLKQNQQFHRKVVLVMIAIPSRTDTDAYKKLRKQIDSLVHDIEDTFGTARWKPIEYITTPLSFTQLSPYFQLADIALVTPIKDGMNLVAKEYIASQGNKDGILVLSKTAGAAEELKQAIIVDPTKRSSLVSGIKEAMMLPQDELRERVTAMQEHISEFTVQEWASNFMGTLKKPVPTPHITRSLSQANQRMLIDSFRSAKQRLLLLDYDGVLAPFRSNPYKAEPSPKVLKVLRKLAALPNTDLVIVSGRSKLDLTDWFEDEPFNLAAEHGAFNRKAGGQRWQTAREMDNSWLDAVLPILQVYTEKTPGAHIETKDSAVVWHYRKASPFYAQKHLVILKRLLARYAKRYDLVIEQGNMILEIRARGATKGHVAEEWMKHNPSFVLAIGDDYTDEDMFHVLPDWANTIKVGRGRTAARFRLPNTDKVLSLLEKLAK